MKCSTSCYLKWVTEGDKRLQCQTHKNRWYVLVDGKPVKCDSAELKKGLNNEKEIEGQRNNRYAKLVKVYPLWRNECVGNSI